jgi:PhnB protein
MEKKKIKPVPEGYRTVTPYLMARRADQAIEFYKRAFGAKERFRMQGQDGRVMHAELQIGDSLVFLCDEFPEMGGKSPETLKGSPVSLFLYVEDVDAWFQQAVDAGATVKTPVADQFWGDRWGALTDPFGHEWHLATRVEEVSPEELERRSTAAMSQS